MIFRPIGASDLARVTPLLTGDEANTLTADQFRRRFQNGQYRAEWTWIAEEAGEEGRSNPPVAVAIWWGRPQDSLPSALDGLVAAAQEGSADRITLAAGLLTTAHQAYARAGADRPPDYHIFLPADWHDRQDAIAEVGWRREAAQQAGLTVALERLGYEWTPDAGLPSRTGRLTFRQEAADAVFAGLFSRVLLGTLDATSRRAAESAGPLAQARQDVRFYREKMLGQRAWWRVAQTPAGEIAGFGIPSQNTDYPVVGYLGVLPEHRGHGYVGEILAEITRILVAETGATAIRADTDLENRPMAAAFERAGYRIHGRRLVVSAPSAGQAGGAAAP